MIYDKNSFVAGVAVGRQMKGWATAGGGGGTEKPWLVEIPGGAFPEDTSAPGTVSSTSLYVRMWEDNRRLNMGRLVDELCGISGWTIIDRAEDETAGTYEATLRTNTVGATVKFSTGTTGTGRGYNHYILIDGVQTAFFSGGAYITGGVDRYGEPYLTEVIYISGTDWEAFQVYRNSTAGGVVAIATDYFDPDKKIALSKGLSNIRLSPFASSNPSMETVYDYSASEKRAVTVPAQAICPYPLADGVTVAAPLNYYSPTLKFSGFIGGLKNLCLCYDGASKAVTGTVDETFTIAGRTFAGGGGRYGVAIRTS